MLKKYFYVFLLIIVLTCSQAVQAQELKSGNTLVKESLVNIGSNDIHVAAQAARYFGIYKAKEGVPVLLRVLESDRFPSSEWVLTDVKAEAIHALGLIGDMRAVPVPKKYLKKSPRKSSILCENVAYALYQITGKSYKYKDRDGKVKLFEKPVVAN